MKRRHAWWTSLVIGAGAVPAAWGQAIPPGAPPAVGAAVAVAPGVAPAPMTLWSFLGCTPEAKEACLRHLCKLQCGQMLNNATAPLGAITGGLIPSLCPVTPTARELAEPGAVGAAAKIKADEAAAKERRAAVRYLGTVDCHYWPEAQDALIAALRSDRNECVRYEAAMAFLNGCCCTKAVIEALNIVISCSDRDGFPKETSARVHGAARLALERCLSCYVEPPKPAPPPVPVPENPEQRKRREEGTNPEQPRTESRKTDEPKKLAAADRPIGKVYYARIADQPLDAIVREGKRALLTTQSTMIPSEGGNSLTKLIERNSLGGEIRGYVVHNDGTPMTNVTVTEKPKNLWDMLVNSNRPVRVTNMPPAGMTETAVRLTPTPQASPVQQANVRPATLPANLALPPATMPVQVPATVEMKPTVPTAQATPATTMPKAVTTAPAPMQPVAGTTAPTVTQASTQQPYPENTHHLVVTSAPAAQPSTTPMPVAPVPAPAKAATPAAAPATMDKPVLVPVTTNAVTTKIEPPKVAVMPKAEAAPAKCEQAKCDEAKCEATKCGGAKCEAGKCDPAKCDPAKCGAGKCDAAKCDAGKCDGGKCDAAKCDGGKCCDTTKAAAPKVDAPKAETPKVIIQTKATDAPRPVETPKVETPKAEAPKAPAGPSDADRVTQLNAINVKQATGDMGTKLLLLAQTDKSEAVRCAAIRAVVRTNVAPELAVPVLAELGMEANTALGKCANDALMQINMKAAGGK